MREIKFRAWDGEKMVSPSYIARNGAAYWKENSIPETSNVVMQYTGLKDKNGVEIYESDICRDMGGNLGVIEWSQDECGWLWLNSDEAQTPFGDCEVIGNIYENPELLDGAA